MSAILESMLLSYSVKTGISEAVQLDSNVYRVLLDGFSIFVEHHKEANAIILHGSIALVQDQYRSALYTRLLQANNMFSETCGLTLGLDSEADAVTLQAIWPLQGLTNEHFETLFDNFIFIVADWMRNLALFSAKLSSSQQQVDSQNQPSTLSFTAMA